jgi:hypothetical protein
MKIKLQDDKNVPIKHLLLFFLFYFSNSHAEFVVSLRSPEIKNDLRESYNYELVTLALEKTKAEYGDYKILAIPPMNVARSLYSVQADVYPNMLIELSYQKKLEVEFNLDYVDFPIGLGIVGYRVCFVSPKARDAVKSAKNIDELKKFTIAQGLAWADTDILRYNGFTVLEVSNYKNIFTMVENSRVDLFCRGANELYKEYISLKDTGNLLYDDSFVLFYPLPRFYYFNKNSKLLKERMRKGLLSAYDDGTLKALWLKHFLVSVEFAELKKRKLYVLQNPFTGSVSTDTLKYFYDPFK